MPPELWCGPAGLLLIKFTAVPPELIRNGDYDYDGKRVVVGLYEKLKRQLKLYNIQFFRITLLFMGPTNETA
jgi:hypothetical protein